MTKVNVHGKTYYMTSYTSKKDVKILLIICAIILIIMGSKDILNKNQILPSKVTTSFIDSTIGKDSKVVVLECGAEWCGWCQKQKPEMKKAHKFLPNVKFESNENESVNERLEINCYPTTILFINGKEINRKSGYMNSDELVSFAKLQRNN